MTEHRGGSGNLPKIGIKHLKPVAKAASTAGGILKMTQSVRPKPARKAGKIATAAAVKSGGS